MQHDPKRCSDLVAAEIGDSTLDNREAEIQQRELVAGDRPAAAAPQCISLPQQAVGDLVELVCGFCSRHSCIALLQVSQETASGYCGAMKPKFVGAVEIADHAGVKVSTVWRWRQRPDFPEPVAELRIGPVWDMRDVQSWMETHRPQPGRPRKDA